MLKRKEKIMSKRIVLSLTTVDIEECLASFLKREPTPQEVDNASAWVSHDFNWENVFESIENIFENRKDSI